MTKGWNKDGGSGWTKKVKDFAKKDDGGGWMNSGAAPGPSWAPYLSEGAAQTFIDLVRKDLLARGTLTLGDGFAKIVIDGKEHQLGFNNLAQICNTCPVEQWPATIAQHFDRVTTMEIDSFDTSTLASVRSSLRVRIYPTEMFASLPKDQLVMREFASGLVETLVIDLPDTIATVSATDRANWDIDDDALFALARKNVTQFEKFSRETIGNAPFESLVGDSFFVASHAIDLRWIDAPRGVLVAIPHRHAVHLHVIKDEKVIPVINQMLVLAHRMFQQGPGSITDQLYLWQDGRYIHQASTIKPDGSVEFRPSPELVALLETLVS